MLYSDPRRRIDVGLAVDGCRPALGRRFRWAKRSTMLVSRPLPVLRLESVQIWQFSVNPPASAPLSNWLVGFFLIEARVASRCFEVVRFSGP